MRNGAAARNGDDAARGYVHADGRNDDGEDELELVFPPRKASCDPASEKAARYEFHRIRPSGKESR